MTARFLIYNDRTLLNKPTSRFLIHKHRTLSSSAAPAGTRWVRGRGCGEGAAGRLLGGELELFEFHAAQFFEAGYLCLEHIAGHVLGQGVGVGPGFANHEHVGACGALKGVVGYAALLFYGVGGENEGGLEGGVLHAFVGLEKAV